MLKKLRARRGKKSKYWSGSSPVLMPIHIGLLTDRIDSKFGVALENGEAHALIEKAVKMDNIMKWSGSTLPYRLPDI